MINKYAEIQKRIILYKAASGVLRVKLAGGEAKRLRQAVRLEPGGVDFIKELNIIRNNPSELRALVAAAAADPSSFTPAQASLINRYGQMYLPKVEFKPAFSPGELSRFEADSARRLQPNQALRSDMQQFANNNSRLLADQRTILSNPSLMNDPAAALKSSRLAAEQAAKAQAEQAAKAQAEKAIAETTSNPTTTSLTKSTAGTVSGTGNAGTKTTKSLLHNKWLLPAAGVAALGTAAGGYYLYNRNKRKDITPYILDNDIN